MMVIYFGVMHGKQDLVIRSHFLHTNDVAALFGDPDVDDSHAASSLDSILTDRSPLALASLGHRQHLAVFRHGARTDQEVSLTEEHASNTIR